MIGIPVRRRGWIALCAAASAVAVLVTLLLTNGDSRRPEPRPTLVDAELRTRDPQATPEARRVYSMLAGLENDARRGKPSGTVIGQHVELQNERYNAEYGDYRGTKQPGYYYGKVRDITGRLPGFTEVDLGPGYGARGWGVGEPRWYSDEKWPTCAARWGSADDAVDLAVGVWAGLPRTPDGSYNASGTREDCASGTDVSLPPNGGGPAGLVGVSFHQPYPGSATKGYEQTLCRNAPAAGDPGWFGRVITPGTGEHKALLRDLGYLADHLHYLADRGVPVLLRPYHEMNAASCDGGFWWAAQKPAAYRALWRITYDYLVDTRALHNLIFVWSPHSYDGKGAVEPGDYYPGSRYVDVVGIDDYSGPPGPTGRDEPWTAVWYRGLERYAKPRVMAESFSVPIGADRPTTLTDTPWVLWTLWGQALTYDNITAPEGKNTTADVKRTYGSEQVFTGGGAAQGARFDWGSLHRR
ncbi:glycoside hydrolase family 26 protein [Streptomyces sp. NBC_01506]|uniref:glycoside hydrolase family 26 protein n=1 Tax=Streptomyces sp. NBC_01506 TaxID=2903887 RepID=UPI003866DCDB